ncbi:hypothetical protein PI125_g17220 [Phytophthora idaei]|nr:hypothetical protein PI125_g17220 [Phytophthora idaei]
MLPELPFFFSPAVFEEARQRMASQTRPSSLMDVLGEMWVKMRGERPSAAANLATPKTGACDDQLTRLIVVLYERRHWLVESSVLMGIHPALNPSATPEELTEMFDVWTPSRRRRLGIRPSMKLLLRSQRRQRSSVKLVYRAKSTLRKPSRARWSVRRASRRSRSNRVLGRSGWSHSRTHCADGRRG